MTIKKDRQPSMTVSPLIEEISGLVIAATWLVITTTTRFNLAVGTARLSTALAVLDGDSLHSGGLSQGQWTAVECTLSRRR